MDAIKLELVDAFNWDQILSPGCSLLDTPSPPLTSVIVDTSVLPFVLRRKKDAQDEKLPKGRGRTKDDLARTSKTLMQIQFFNLIDVQ